MTKNDIEKALVAAAAHTRSKVDSSQVTIAERIAHVNAQTIAFKRDERLHAVFNASVLNLTSPVHGKPDKRRILAIIGESGSGKTTALVAHTAHHEALQPYEDEDGVLIKPLLMFDAPSPCTPRLLAVAGLAEMGVEFRDSIRENEAWLRFRQMIVKFGVRMIVIDEMQNAIETASVREATIVGDALKQLVQMKGWPIRLVVAGVPPLSSFMARKQLKNRTTFVHFEAIDPSQDLSLLKAVVERVVKDHALLEVDHSLDDDFLSRLAHSSSYNLGSIIQTVRETVEIVLYAGRDRVNAADFAEGYALASGCKRSENVFTSSRWADIDVTIAPLREGDEAWERERTLAKGTRGTKFGVRPQ